MRTRLFKNIPQNAARIAAGIFALLLLALNIARAALVTITCDEAPSRSDLLLTYGDYVHLTKVTANIHILNSILRKACIDVLGNSPFALRLPNIAAQAVFLVFGYALICRLFKGAFWRLAAFAAINLNPFLFEFWGYSRGYGLAIGFMMLSLYALATFTDTGKPRRLWLSLIAAAAAVWSNFALLNFYVALCGVLVALPAWQRSWKGLAIKTLPAIAVISGMLGWLIYLPIQKLRASGELYYGGDKGLFADTLRSLVRESLYIGDPARPLILYTALLIAGGIVASIAYWMAQAIISRTAIETRRGVMLSLLLGIPLLSMLIQHKLLGTKYLIDRTALFLVVLFTLQVMLWLYHFRTRFALLSRLGVAAILVVSLSNFCTHINVNRSRTWWYDEHDLQALKLILSDAKDLPRPVALRTSWMHMPAVDYYVYTRYHSRFTPLEYVHEPPTAADTSYDYIYVHLEDAQHLSPRYSLLHSFDDYNVYKKRPALH